MICIDDAGVSYAPPLEASSRSTFPLYHYWLEVVIIGDVRVFLVTFSPGLNRRMSCLVCW
jgi:hypothetical protein